MGANPALTRFSYRYELEWKDRVYCDADFSVLNERETRIVFRFVNRTDRPQSVAMNLSAALQYPSVKRHAELVGYRIPFEPKLPDRCRFLDAISYDAICCGQTLAQDGKYLGEAFFTGATGFGTALDGRFFHDRERHYLHYKFDPTDADSVGIRYLSQTDTALYITVNGEKYRLPLSAVAEFGYAVLPFKAREISEIQISPDGASVTVDCLIIGKNAAATTFAAIPLCFEPQKEEFEDRLLLSYKGLEKSYSIEWDQHPLMLRTYYCDEIGEQVQKCVHDHVSTIIRSGRPSQNV